MINRYHIYLPGLAIIQEKQHFIFIIRDAVVDFLYFKIFKNNCEVQLMFESLLMINDNLVS